MDSFTNWLSKIEPALHSHNKLHLVIVFYSFYVLLGVFVASSWRTVREENEESRAMGDLLPILGTVAFLLGEEDAPPSEC